MSEEFLKRTRRTYSTRHPPPATITSMGVCHSTTATWEPTDLFVDSPFDRVTLRRRLERELRDTPLECYTVDRDTYLLELRRLRRIIAVRDRFAPLQTVEQEVQALVAELRLHALRSHPSAADHENAIGWMAAQ